ncbi:hypothetical protein HPB50_023655 [Hyalomma asiaticum]|uniref:Uncharacterized protein n=1 Tax=Hyalomma asiaticum TaxID=266040 RepID=A0ACB7T6R9_HYAAI|nr:hypothetical protein HPB50_023655 [Hyalomma asiaticum]
MDFRKLMCPPNSPTRVRQLHRIEDMSSSPDQDEGPRLVTSPLDSDVAREAVMADKLVSRPMPDEYALVVHKLTKSFGPCRGTKLMQLLTDSYECSSGDVYIGSWSLLRTPRTYAANIGYCPESVCMPEHLTGHEIIELVCVLRGFRLNDTAAMTKNLLHIMELSRVANVVVGHYTPGDKRKLCIAVALAGLPSVVLLDEPSTGVDVAARAQIRRSLSIIRHMTDCAILLTSNRLGPRFRAFLTHTL